MNTNAPKASSREPLKVGVVGLGRAGWNIHIQAMKGDERFRVVDVADPSEERRAEATQELGCRAFASLEELLRRGNQRSSLWPRPISPMKPTPLRFLNPAGIAFAKSPMAGDYEGRSALPRLRRNRDESFLCIINTSFPRSTSSSPKLWRAD